MVLAIDAANTLKETETMYRNQEYRDLAASQERQDKMDPAGAGKRAESRTQLVALQAAREAAGWNTIEARALEVAIDVHIGTGPRTLALSMRQLHDHLAR